MARLLDSGVLTDTGAAELVALTQATKTAQLTREIVRIQDQLIKLSAAKTQAATRAS